MPKKPGTYKKKKSLTAGLKKAGKAAGKAASKAGRKTGKVAKKAAGALMAGAAAGASAKRKTSSTKKSSGPTRRSSIGSSIGKDGYRPRRNQRSRAPYQETDTGPGLMPATGSKTRKKKPLVRRKK